MNIFNNTAMGELLFSSVVQAGAWMSQGCAALLLLLSVVARQESRHHREN